MTASTVATSFALILAALFGLVIGSFLNVVVYRVPAGIPLTRESRCPGCDSPVRPWQNVPVLSWLALRGRCASCGTPISARYPLVEAVTALAFVAVVWSALSVGTITTAMPLPSVLVIVAYLYFAAISIALTLIDLDTRRLPNAIVLPSYLVAGVLFAVASLVDGGWEPLLRAGVGMGVLYLFYALLRLVKPGAMGGGDVKLAGVIGLYLGWIGWPALIVGGFSAFLLGGLFGVVLLVTRRAQRSTAIPFGPWMIFGAWVGIFAGEALATWYVGLFVA